MEFSFGEYRQECPVTFGLGSIKNLGATAKQLGGKRVLAIYDPGVEKSGIADKVIQVLLDEGLAVERYADIKPDPKDDDIDVAGDYARAKEVDLVVGIGGGSVLDAAKMVGVLLRNPGSISQFFLSKGFSQPETAPIILVTTASGTGSEVTRVAVVSDHKSKAKDGVFASGTYAFVDPELTLTAPSRVTASSGLDAMAHAIESFTTPNPDPLSSLLALEAIKLINQHLLQAVENGQDVEARTQLSIASNFAGLAFNNTGVHFGHALGHELGTQFSLPHGIACSYGLPAVVEYTGKHNRERVLRIAQAMNVATTDAMSGQEIGESIANYLRKVTKKCAIPSLKELDITKEQAIGCAENAISTNGFYHNSIVPMLLEEFKTVIGNIYDKYQ